LLFAATGAFATGLRARVILESKRPDVFFAATALLADFLPAVLAAPVMVCVFFF
jgi:hypothetical protein